MTEKETAGPKPRRIILWPHRIESGELAQGALFELLGTGKDNIEFIRYLTLEDQHSIRASRRGLTRTERVEK
jgi:hypothetical protein